MPFILSSYATHTLSLLLPFSHISFLSFCFFSTQTVCLFPSISPFLPLPISCPSFPPLPLPFFFLPSTHRFSPRLPVCPPGQPVW